MNLKDYMASMPRGEATWLAEKLEISLSYLSQLASGRSSVSPERCISIEQATNGEVTRKDLRPEDWERIWPELVKGGGLMGFSHKTNSMCQVVVGFGLLGGCGGGSAIRLGEAVHSVVLGNKPNQSLGGGNLISTHQEIDPIQSNSAGRECTPLWTLLAHPLALAALFRTSFLRPLVSAFQVALLRVRSLISGFHP